MILNVNISKEEVFDAVAKIAGYTAKNEAMMPDAPKDIYKRIAIFEPYRELLDDRFESGCNSLTDVFGEQGPYIVDLNEEYSIGCEMPYNWSYALSGEVQRTAKSFLVAFMTTLWMRIVKQADEEKYAKESDASILLLSSLLHKRRRVSRREFVEYIRNRRKENKEEEFFNSEMYSV